MDRDARITVKEAAYLAMVATGTVRNWRYKGWLDRDGRRRFLDANSDGYLVSDVLDAERDTRSSRRSHRRMGPPELAKAC